MSKKYKIYNQGSLLVFCTEKLHNSFQTLNKFLLAKNLLITVCQIPLYNIMHDGTLKSTILKLFREQNQNINSQGTCDRNNSDRHLNKRNKKNNMLLYTCHHPQFFSLYTQVIIDKINYTISRLEQEPADEVTKNENKICLGVRHASCRWKVKNEKKFGKRKLRCKQNSY